MQTKIFIVCQFSDKLSLLERKLCLLTGRRKFKRTEMKETVKTKWELRMQERKNSRRLSTKLVHSLTFFSCGQDMLSFNLLPSWVLLSGWVSSSFCKGGEDFCSSPVCWQVCFPESMEWKSSPQLLAGCPMACCCLLLLIFCFFSQVVPVTPWEGVPRTSAFLELVTSCLAPGKHSGAEMGKFTLVLGKVCLWLFLTLARRGYLDCICNVAKGKVRSAKRPWFVGKSPDAAGFVALVPSFWPYWWLSVCSARPWLLSWPAASFQQLLMGLHPTNWLKHSKESTRRSPQAPCTASSLAAIQRQWKR